MKIFVSFIIVIFVINSCHVGRFAVYNFANIDDYKKFQNRTLAASENPFHFISNPDSVNFLPVTKEFNYSSNSEFEEMLNKTKTVCFLVIQNDTIKYEYYDDKFTEESMFTSFSMSKSYVSALVGFAIEDGFIKSVEEPITNYIKSFKHDGVEKITIENVLNMRTGIDYNESYINPFGNVAVGYYGRNLDQHLSKIKIKDAPDKKFDYVSIATQILGIIIAEATGKTVSEYCEEKIWKPLGMEWEASWSLDKKNGIEKSFCCLNARALDYAKFGRFYLNKGNWEGKQLLSEEWIDKSVTVHENTKDNFYQYHWWLEPGRVNNAYGNVDYMAQGILGQFTYISPKKNTIIIRLGKKYGNANWRTVFSKIISTI